MNLPGLNFESAGRNRHGNGKIHLSVTLAAKKGEKNHIIDGTCLFFSTGAAQPDGGLYIVGIES